MYTDRPFCLICKGVAGMQMLVLSSYVVDNAKANVGFNRKFLKLATSCCEKTVFVTSNYPEELLEGLPGLTVENLPYRWDSSQRKTFPDISECSAGRSGISAAIIPKACPSCSGSAVP